MQDVTEMKWKHEKVNKTMGGLPPPPLQVEGELILWWVGMGSSIKCASSACSVQSAAHTVHAWKTKKKTACWWCCLVLTPPRRHGAPAKCWV